MSTCIVTGRSFLLPQRCIYKGGRYVEYRTFQLVWDAFIIFFLQRKNQLREAYSNNLWDGARNTLATLWDGHGAIWHGNALHGPKICGLILFVFHVQLQDSVEMILSCIFELMCKTHCKPQCVSSMTQLWKTGILLCHTFLVSIFAGQ